MSDSSRSRTALAAVALLLLGSGTALGSHSPAEAALPPAQDLRQFACPPDRVPDAGFADTADSPFRLEIDCLAGYRITSGVAPGSYAPAAAVLRGQMAQFVARVATDHAGLRLDPADAGFTDLGALSPGARDAINGLANAGIVSGRTATTFEPHGPVRRDQMATFLARLQEKAAGAFLPGEDLFTDDNGNPHEDSINRLSMIGIVTGTGDRSYTPAGHVTRQQMSAFLMRYVADRIDSGEIRSRYPNGEPARVDLGAETVIAGTSSGKIPVRLSEPATLARPGHQKEGGVRIDGEGRFVGFALVADGTDPHRVKIRGGRVDSGLGYETALIANHSFAEIETTDEDDWILPAGDYHLYLITDSRPTSVTLLLDGPTGIRRLAPAVPVASSVARPEPRLSPQGATTAGALGELRGEGLLLQLYVVLNSATLAEQFTTCVYRGEAALTASHAPGCPDAQMRGVPLVIVPVPERGIGYGTFAVYLGKGSPIAQGYSYNRASINEHVDYTAMWLTL